MTEAITIILCAVATAATYAYTWRREDRAEDRVREHVATVTLEMPQPEIVRDGEGVALIGECKACGRRGRNSIGAQFGDGEILMVCRDHEWLLIDVVDEMREESLTL